MKIRKKILIYFSLSSIILVGLSFVLIYSLFSNYRIEQFQERIKEQTRSTVQFLTDAKMMNEEIIQNLDDFVINNFFKEKILIFDENKKMIYSSIDDTKIYFQANLLNLLSADNPDFEGTENEYDVVGMYFTYEGKNYYGLAKAYDKSGLEKLAFLKYTLLTIFILISSIILITSSWISKQITSPLNKMADEMLNISLENDRKFIEVPESNDEINVLAKQFNELMKRLNESYAYQRHAIHHLSHELKTPLAILVSNFEKLEKNQDIESLHKGLQIQKENTKNLSDVINVLLEISKLDSGQVLEKQVIRIDDLLFDVIDHLNVLDEDFRFEVEIDESVRSDEELTLQLNERLLRIALLNLAENAMNYSDTGSAGVKISFIQNNLVVSFTNAGTPISSDEKAYLFQHFFRGKNSVGKKGFGLGLVMIAKIMNYLDLEISYSSPDSNTSVFTITFPAEPPFL